MAGQRSRHRMRCRNCRRKGRNWRFTIRVGRWRNAKSGRGTPIKCPCCRSDDVVSIEASYVKAERKRRHLYCDILYCRVPHPHRKSTHQLCPAYQHDRPMDDALMEELEAMERHLVLDYPGRTATA